jgi:hypothetical protein
MNLKFSPPEWATNVLSFLILVGIFAFFLYLPWIFQI